MKKIYSLILFVYVSTTMSYAQEVRYRDYQGNGNYANSDSIFRPEGIASDFGPRKIDDNWH